MAKNDYLIKETVAILLALIATFPAPLTAQEDEKCYGIVKAGMNDCATHNHSCAGSATQDKQPDAYIFLPKGACEKIVGASTQSLSKAQKTDNKDAK